MSCAPLIMWGSFATIHDDRVAGMAGLSQTSTNTIWYNTRRRHS